MKENDDKNRLLFIFFKYYILKILYIVSVKLGEAREDTIFILGKLRVMSDPKLIELL